MEKSAKKTSTNTTEFWKKWPVGKYSGNPRLDPANFEEPEIDSDYTRQMWFEDIKNDEDFLADVQEEVNKWKQMVKITANPEKLDIHIVGQSHIDMCWKWRYEQTRKKNLVTFKKAILHSKLFPGSFTYAASEPILIDWLQEDDPEMYKQLKETVKNGGVELVGGSYVEPDCMMPSGEAFVRQRLYGMCFYKNHFNILPKVEWFLDSFGYNYGLPQILKKSGAEYFWTSKITWNRQTQFPFVNFWWQSPDGTKLLTANFQQNWAPLNSWMRFEIGRHPILPDGKKVWNYEDDYETIDEHIDDDPEKVIPPVGIFAGKGDGGHGPTHQEVTFNNAVSQLGVAKWSRAENFFKALEPYGDVLPIWADELYLEYHRGTFSVHFEVKRHNRYYENIFNSVERLASLLTLFNPEYKYPQKTLESLWKIVLLNQFHDCLPGSSIPEVYDDVWDFWQICNKSIEEMVDDWGAHLNVPKSAELTLTNPVAWERKSPTFISLDQIPSSLSCELDGSGKPPYIELTRVDNPSEVLIGQPVPAEKGELDDTKTAGWWVVPTLGSLATICYSVGVLEEIPESSIEVAENYIDNGSVKIALDPNTGAMIGLSSEKINDGRNLVKGDRSNLTLGFLDDFPHDHAWNIKPQYWKFPLDIPNDTDVKIVVKENGPVFCTLEISRILGNGEPKEKLEANSTIGANRVTQSITLFEGIPKVFMKYEADWNQPWLMLKIPFDTATDAEYDVSDQAYCAIKRSTRPKVPNDKARYEKIMQKYVDLSTPDNTWGLALLNNGKYAYDASEGTMRLTLLRTPKYPTSAGEAWVNTERKQRLNTDGTAPPDFVDIGFLRCRYALFPHRGGSLLDENGAANPETKCAAEEFNQPNVVQKVTGSGDTAEFPINGEPVVQILPSNVLIGALKRKEWETSDNLIIRVSEVCGMESSKSEITFPQEIAQKIENLTAIDLLERPINRDFSWNSEKGVLSFTIGKFEIQSFELILK